MTQEAFNQAKQAYKNLLDVLGATLNTFNNNVPEDKRVDPRGFQIKFDILLQHSLINIAISDEEMFMDELVLIHDITDLGDIVLFFRDVYKNEMTWEDLYKMSPSDVARILKEQEENIAYLADDFVKIVSVVDAVVTEYDVTGMLFHEVETVVKVLMCLDGEIKEDAEKVNSTYILHLFNQISERKSEIQKNCSAPVEPEEECSSQSLEDVFNKKRK